MMQTSSEDEEDDDADAMGAHTGRRQQAGGGGDASEPQQQRQPQPSLVGGRLYLPSGSKVKGAPRPSLDSRASSTPDAVMVLTPTMAALQRKYGNAGAEGATPGVGVWGEGWWWGGGGL